MKPAMLLMAAVLLVFAVAGSAGVLLAYFLVGLFG